MVGSKFFIFGGQRDDGSFMNDLVWFDLQKRTPVPHGCLCFLLLILTSPILPSCFAVKAGVPQWSFVEYAPGALVPPKRTGHTTVTHADSIYIFGGTDGNFHYNDTWAYDTTTHSWTELSCIGYIPVPREGHAATLVDDVMYVFGGRGVDGKDLEDLAAFKISTQRWFMFQNMGPAPSGRSGHAMATWQNKVYVLGGESYTSSRADDPSMLHVLDTSKIKYPADSSKSNVGRKSSIPTIAGNALGSSAGSAPPTGPPSHQPPMSPALNSSAASSQQSAGAPGRTGHLVNGVPLVGGAAPPSFGQVAEAAGKGPKRGPPGPGGPQRPARPDDGSDSLTTSPADRARSPTDSQQGRNQTRGATQSPQNANNQPGPARARTSPPQPGEAQFAGQPRQRQLSAEDDAPGSANGHGHAGAGGFYVPNPRTNGRSPSPASARRPSGAGPSVEQLAAKDDEIRTLQARETWMKTALAMATRRGFVPAEALQGLDGPSLEQMQPALEEGNQRQIVAALLQLKQELAAAKATLAEQAHTTNDKVAGAAKAKAAALQEAAYCRAKLAALEAGNAGEASKLDRDRAVELERKLAETVSAKLVLERQVSKLEHEVADHAEHKQAAEERHSAAAQRAEAAEGSYSRSLSDYAELQRRAHAHEATIQDHQDQLVALGSRSRQVEADHAALQEKHSAAEASVTHHVQALGEAQAALDAAHSRNEHLHGAWQTAQKGADEHSARTGELDAALQAKTAEHEQALAKVAELEASVEQHRRAEEATAALATGGVAALIAHHEATKTRDVDGAADPAAAAKIEALEDELKAVREQHAGATGQREQATTELTEVRTREVGLQSQLGQVRAELALLRAQHTAAIEEAGTHRLAAVDREAEAREAHQAREQAEVQAGLLRNIMADHGLHVADEDLTERYPPLEETATPETLHRRVHDLQAELDRRTKDHAELSTQHDDARRELAEAEKRHAEEVQGLSATAERGAANGQAGEELSALQAKYTQLETTHLKAVQYVKGTEKMLRRMKEELTRFKDKCETMEKERGQVPEEAQREMDLLRQQLLTVSAKHGQEREDLQRRLTGLQTEHERALDDHREEHDRQVQEIEAELANVKDRLASAHHDLEETLAVNASLNQSLTSALKDPASPRGTASASGASLATLEAELEAATTKAEWLRRENEELEHKCVAAEEKIAILLDHLEGATGTTDVEGKYSAGEAGNLRGWAGGEGDSEVELGSGGEEEGSEYEYGRAEQRHRV